MHKSKKRFIYMVLVGVLVAFVLKIIIPFPDNGARVQIMGFVESIFITFWCFNEYVCEIPYNEQGLFLSISITIGLLVSLILLSVETGLFFFRNWKESLVQVEKYKSESAQANLENLKNQVNPHFLFNNLSVLL